MQYRIPKTPGATFFFTVVTYRRNKILCHEANVALIKEAFLHVNATNHLFLPFLSLCVLCGLCGIIISGGYALLNLLFPPRVQKPWK